MPVGADSFTGIQATRNEKIPNTAAVNVTIPRIGSKQALRSYFTERMP